MSQSVNPLRIVAETQYGVDGGSTNLVANGIYSVDEILRPILSDSDSSGDPRLFFSSGGRKRKISWRRVNRDGWISPKGKARDDKDTVIQIRFARPKRFNRMSFELLRVPQEWTIKYYDYTRKRMVVLTDVRGQKVNGSLSGFKNNVLTPRHEKNNSHKWRDYRYELPIIKTNLIEIHLNREVRTPPIYNLNDFFGLPRDTPYSLGIRNLKLKLRINDDDDDDDDDGTPTPIGTTERPVITRYTSINAHDGDTQSYWECGPQGAANSVVPFYMDMRQNDGSASIFDTIKLTPLWTGPNMSVYWSNDDVTTPWQLSPNRKRFIRVGDADFTEDVGFTVEAAGDAWTISNDYVKMDLTKSFTVGLMFTPTDTNTAGERYLWNFERPDLGLSLKFNCSGGNTASDMTGEFEVVKTVAGVETTLYTSSTYTLDIDVQHGIVLGYTVDTLDPTSSVGWHLAFAVQPATDSTIVTETDTDDPLVGFHPTSFNVGSSVTLVNPAQGSITRLWARMDAWSEAAVRWYLKSPDVFISGQGDKTQRTNGFYNGVLIAKLSKTIEARIGPGAGFYNNKEWTPVPIDYGLDTSHYLLPLLNAKFLKLEFTGLIPRVYMTEEPVLPVTSFPQEVVSYFRSTHRVGQKGPYALNVGRQFFEAVPPPRTPGDPRVMSDLRRTLDGNGAGGVPPIIYHADQSSNDFVVNADTFDGSNRYRELEFATTPMRFHRAGRHTYETQYVEVEHRAFFVGIKDLQVFRTDHTVQFDSREYNETYDDDLYIEDSTGWINVGSVLAAQQSGVTITSKVFESFSKFDHIQMAVLDSQWESGFTDAENDFGTIAHLVDPQGTVLDSSTSTVYSVVTGQYQGERGGNVIQFNRLAGSVDEYGIQTATGEYTSTLTVDGGARTSTVIRLQLPETNKGTYELRLYSNGTLAAARSIQIPIRAWKEIELAYISNIGDGNFQAEVVQTNPAVFEPFIVDMLGIWQNPVRWEITNDVDELPMIFWEGGPDISDLGNPEFVSQDLDGPYEPPQVVANETTSVVSFTVTWLEDLPQIFDISELGDTDSPEYPAQNLDLEYLPPQSFKVTYNGYETGQIMRGATEAETADNLGAALALLPGFADIELAVYLGPGTEEYIVVFEDSGLILEDFGVTDLASALVEAETLYGSGSWHIILWPLNNSKAYFQFPTEDYRLRVRTTALRAGAVVSGWTIVPWYIESSMVMRAPIDYNPPWGVSDQEDLLDTSRKPIFQTWNHFFPQRFSINLYGYY